MMPSVLNTFNFDNCISVPDVKNDSTEVIIKPKNSTNTSRVSLF